MPKEVPKLMDLVSPLGTPPEGVDHVDYAIASLPPKDLTRAARNSTFSYEGLKSIVDKDPEFLDRYDKVPHPQKSFADEILVRQQQLSRGRRYMATIGAVLAIGSGGFTYGYKSDGSMQREVFGHNHPVDVAEEVRDGAIFGGLVGVLGGFVVTFAGLEIAGRLAKRPAQKIVDRAITFKK